MVTHPQVPDTDLDILEEVAEAHPHPTSTLLTHKDRTPDPGAHPLVAQELIMPPEDPIHPQIAILAILQILKQITHPLLNPQMGDPHQIPQVGIHPTQWPHPTR